MRKFAVGVLASLLLLTGCGGGDSAESADGKVTISFSHCALSAPPFQAFTDVIDDFNESQDKITVKVVNVPYENYHNTIFTQLGAGKGPTVVSVEDYDLGQAIDAGLTADLTDKITPPTAGFADWDKRMFTDDKRMAVGYTAHPYQLLVNRAALDKLGEDVPTTYDEFLALAQKATKGSDNFGFAFRSSQAEAAGWWLDLNNWVVGQGGRFSDENGNPTINSTEVKNAVTRMKEFRDEKLVPVGTDAPTYRRAFGEGKIPMIIESLAMGSILASQNPALAKSLEVHPLPFGTGDYMMTTHAMFVNSKASDAEQDAAVEFLNYLLTDEVQTKMVDTMGGSLGATDQPIPAKAAEAWPWLKGWTPSGPSVSSTPVGAEVKFVEFRTIVLGHVEKIFAGRESVDEGLDAAQKEAEELLAD
jgi:multiple sugar transport system substrate-binding protein